LQIALSGGKRPTALPLKIHGETTPGSRLGFKPDMQLLSVKYTDNGRIFPAGGLHKLPVLILPRLCEFQEGQRAIGRFREVELFKTQPNTVAICNLRKRGIPFVKTWNNHHSFGLIKLKVLK